MLTAQAHQKAIASHYVTLKKGLFFKDSDIPDECSVGEYRGFFFFISNICSDRKKVKSQACSMLRSARSNYSQRVRAHLLKEKPSLDTVAVNIYYLLTSRIAI